MTEDGKEVSQEEASHTARWKDALERYERELASAIEDVKRGYYLAWGAVGGIFLFMVFFDTYTVDAKDWFFLITLPLIYLCYRWYRSARRQALDRLWEAQVDRFESIGFGKAYEARREIHDRLGFDRWLIGW